MRNADKLAGELLAKAENDLTAAKIGLAHDAPLDTVCFHVQQTVEKMLKALLCAGEVRFPATHDLDVLLNLLIPFHPEFERFRDRLESFAPYAVELRYTSSFYPSAEEARSALNTAAELAGEVRRLLLER